MDSEKIDELAAIAYEAFSENNMFTASPWRHLDSIQKDAWRRVVIEMTNRAISQESADNAWCQWIIAAGDVSGITNTKYERVITLTQKEKWSKQGDSRFSIDATLALEYFNRLTQQGVSWARIVWKLGS